MSPVPGLAQGLGTTGPARGPRRSSRPLWGRGKHSCRLERGAAKLSILACAWTCFEAWRCSESLFEAPGRTSWLWEGTPWLRCACASAWPRGHSAFEASIACFWSAAERVEGAFEARSAKEVGSFGELLPEPLQGPQTTESRSDRAQCLRLSRSGRLDGSTKKALRF